MDVSSVGTTPTTGSVADRQLIADNLDTFLQLLVVQLRNQDPLEPMDTNEFTGQLVQFSQVEQSVKSNELLESLVAANSLSASQAAVGYIGKVVTADGATTRYSDGSATWALRATDDATKAVFTVRDQSGSVIFTTSEPLEAGTSIFTWDGSTTTGQPALEGLYTLTVSAQDANGKTVAVSTKIQGTVRGVDFDGGEPLLDVGGIKVRLSAVSAIELPQSDGNPNADADNDPDADLDTEIETEPGEESDA